MGNFYEASGHLVSFSLVHNTIPAKSCRWIGCCNSLEWGHVTQCRSTSEMFTLADETARKINLSLRMNSQAQS